MKQLGTARDSKSASSWYSRSESMVAEATEAMARRRVLMSIMAAASLVDGRCFGSGRDDWVCESGV